MKKLSKLIIILVVALALVSGSCMVITNENEYSLVRQFGKVDRIVEESGISFKVPFIETIDKLPKQTLIYDLTPSDVITADKKTMISNSYVLWKISNPLKFAQTLNSSVSNAENRLDNIVYNATKNVISSMNQDEVITSRDGALSAAVLENIGTSLDNYGITLLSFELKQLDLPNDNKTAVYERMISERDNIAATYTAEGDSEARIIRNTTDAEITILLSEAEKNAEILLAEGEAEYMRILSEAYNDISKADFYTFVRSLDAVKSTMTGNNKTIILSPESPIAQIFYGQ
jgi:membrane protease subunit HflC